MLEKNIKILTWFNFFCDFKLYAPFAIVYFSQISGSYALGTSIFSIVMISSSLFEVPTGILSDFIGRKKTIILGSMSAILYVSMYALASNYWFLVVGAILEGLTRSFYSGNNEALLHDSLKQMGKENNYHHYLSRLSSMFQIGLTIAALLGSLLSFWSISAVFWASVLAQVVCLILSFQIIDPKVVSGESGNIYNHLKQSINLFIKNPQLRLLSLSNIFSFGFGEASYFFRPAFFSSIWPTWAFGFATALSNLGAVVGYFLGSKLMNKYKGSNVLFLGSILNRIIDFVALLLPSILSPVLMSGTAIHYGISQIVKGSLMQKEFSEPQRATMGSLNAFAGSLLFAIIFFVLGFIADKFTPTQALIGLEFFLLINVYIYYKLFKNS